MIYLLCFAASAGLAFLTNKTTNRRNLYIFSFCSIAIMVLLAGLRDYGIGTDTMNYLIKDRYWAGAISADSLIDYLRFYFPLGYGDPLFALLIGSIAQLTGSFRVFLKMVEGYTAFNKATDYKYQEIVSRRIKTLKYNCARLNKDLKAMRSGELREIYKS